MALLKTNYKDDILLDTSGKRKYTMITNDDGTVSFVDVTDYSQNGDAFGAADINATNTEVNEHFASVDKSLEALNTKIGAYFPAPDYENAVTINTNTYTAPADGWVSAFASRAANGASVSAPMKAIIYVNDIRVSEAVSTSGYPYARLSPVPVRAGDNIKYDVAGQSGGGALRYFYPVR